MLLEQFSKERAKEASSNKQEVQIIDNKKEESKQEKQNEQANRD